MKLRKLVHNILVAELTRRHVGLDRARDLGPVILDILEFFRNPSKNPQVLYFLLGFVGLVIIKKLFDYFFRRSNS